MNTTICYILTFIIEAIVGYYYFAHKLTIKRNFLTTTLTFAAAYTVLFIFALLNIPYLNGLTFLLANIIILCICFKEKLISKIFHSCLYAIAMIATEVAILCIPHSFFMKYPSPDLTEPTMLVTFIISKSLLFILIVITVKLFPKKSEFHKYNIPLHIIIITLTSACIMMILAYICVTVRLEKNTEAMILISCAGIIIINITMLWLQEYIEENQAKFYSLRFTKEQEKNYKHYYELAKESDENQRILIHDIKNHLQIINEHIQMKNYDDANNYIKQLITSPALGRQVNLTTCENLNILLATYLTRCEQSLISLKIDSHPIDLDFIELQHLTSIFCNLLDNAVDAAQDSPAPYIDLIIRKVKDSDIVKISVTNSCSKPPLMDNHGNLITSKNDARKHGIGSLSLTNATKPYDGEIERYYDKESNAFKTIILLHDIQLRERIINGTYK